VSEGQHGRILHRFASICAYQGIAARELAMVSGINFDVEAWVFHLVKVKGKVSREKP